ncbi:MAG: repeat-containing protein [Chitinophagaceae bacterium]|nr:repeat-containing protein [Chitinophagaceae bacterium]
MKENLFRTNFFLIAFLLYLISSSDVMSSVNDSSVIQTKYDKAFTYYKKEQWPQAIICFTDVIREDPSYVKAYLYRGASYGMMNNSDSAIANYRKVLMLDPKNKSAHKVLGLVRYDLKEYNEAILVFTKGIEYYSSEGFFYYYRGLCYFLLDNYSLALPDLDKSISLAGKNAAEAYILKATIKRNEKKFNEASSILEEFFLKYPDNKMGYYERGLFYFDQNDFKNAVIDLEKSITLDPEFYAKAYFWVAEAKRLQGQDSEALENYNIYILKGDPTVTNKGYLGRVACYTNLNRKTEAYTNIQLYENSKGTRNASYYLIKQQLLDKYDDYKSLVALYTSKEKDEIEDSMLYFKQGIAYENLDQRTEAENAFKKAAFTGKPNQWYKWYSKGLVAAYEKDYKGSIVEFNKAIETGGPYAKISFAKGFMLYQDKNYLEAYKEFGKAMEVDSQFAQTHPEIYLYNANIKNNTGSSKQSLGELNKYITQKPTSYIGYYNRGKYYYLQKEYALSVEDFNKALSKTDATDKESIYSFLVNAYNDSGKKLEAIKTLDKMIELYREPSYYMIRSTIKSDLNLPYKEVLGDINMSIAMDAGNGYYYFMRGMYKQKYDTDTTQICPDLIKALQLGVPTEVKLIKESLCGK